MSTDNPDNDPFRKPPSEPPPQQPPAGSPYGGPPPPGGTGGGPGGAYGAPYGGSPYGHASGATDPLAGMPPLANRGKRLLARIIDALIIGIPVGLIAGLIAGFDYDDNNTNVWQGGLYTLIYFIYEGVMLSKSGQTIGKKVMKIRVAMLRDGAVPTGSSAWGRAAVYQLPTLVPCLGTLFWLVNVLFCTWDQPYRQCLHDKTVKTVAVAAD